MSLPKLHLSQSPSATIVCVSSNLALGCDPIALEIHCLLQHTVQASPGIPCCNLPTSHAHLPAGFCWKWFYMLMGGLGDQISQPHHGSTYGFCVPFFTRTILFLLSYTCVFVAGDTLVLSPAVSLCASVLSTYHPCPHRIS